MRECGILLPIFSLPSKYGIGTFGKWAYKFIDLLKQTGHSHWQMLPLCQTGFGDSPYQTVCDYSGNPYFIDPEILRSKKLLTYRETEKYIDKSEKINYENLYNSRYQMLRLAFSRFDVNCPGFKNFLRRGQFNDYALFMALKGKFNDSWNNWPAEYKFRNEQALREFERENKQEILFWQFVQFEFSEQFKQLKKYANLKGVKLVGDLPFYLSFDSVDVWANPQYFMLDENYKPSLVAGVPPDYFSSTGQLWGNPVYNWEEIRKAGFEFWKNRVDNARKFFDLVRIDHFRGLDRFWVVKYGDETAEKGWWVDGPKMDLFNAIGSHGIFAEDLGMIDDGVRNLLSQANLSGLKVLQFAFDSDENNLYLPWNISENSITYTGTHDNSTLVGYVKGLSKEELEKQKAKIQKSLTYLGINKPLSGVYKISEAIINVCYGSKSKLAIVPMQDILFLDDDFRTNTPGKTGAWQVRLKESLVFSENVSNFMKRLAKRYNRY